MAEVSTLVSNIRVLLDMNNSSEALISASDIDALTLDEVIRGKLVDAARFIESQAPLYLVEGEAMVPSTKESPFNETYTLINDDLYKGIFSLTTFPDFLRLLKFQLGSWERPAGIILEEDPRYLLQTSKYGIKGTPEAPIAAIVRSDTGLRIETYSSELTATAEKPNPADTITTALYLPIRAIKTDTTSGNEVITISSKLQSAIEHYAAYLTCLTYGNANLASYMLQQAMTLAEIPTAPVQQTTNNNNE